MLTRALKMAFWVMHDHLGKLMLFNVLWAMSLAGSAYLVSASLAPGVPSRLTMMTGLGIAGLFVLAAPVLMAGCAHMVKTFIETNDGTLGDFTAGIRLYWRRAAGVGLCFTAGSVSLFTSAWFYPAKLQDNAPLVGYTLSALAIWCLAFAGVAAPFVMPALVQKRAGVWATLKLSGLLVLDNPGFALGVAFQIAVVTIIAAIVWPIFFVLYGAFVIVLGSCAYELLARKYAVVAERGMEAWKKRDVAAEDAENDYLNRGLRDLVFPWKG